jgi:DNA polymerase-3 subunit epsilon
MSAGRADWRARRLVSLDFETTGLDPRRDEVISFGAVPIVGGRIRLGASESLIVDPGVVPSPDSIRVHQLRPVDVAAGATVESGRRRLSSVLGDDLIVVWTAWVEAAFLAKMLGGTPHRWLRRLVDVRPLVIHLDERSGLAPSPAREQNLAATAARFGVPPEPGHDALADAFVTAELFLVVTTRLEATGVFDIRSLRRLGRRAPAPPG